MRKTIHHLKLVLALCLMTLLSGCDPQVYGSIGVSSGFGSYHGSGGRMHGSISVGGRIR